MFAACNKKDTPPEKAATVQDGNFSIITFTRDQWKTFHDQTFAFYKVVTQNGKSDTTFLSCTNMEWVSVCRTFFASDIGDPEFSGKYTFSDFIDPTMGTHNYFYEATNNDLFTRKLQIAVDSVDNKIRYIYVETEKSDDVATHTQKLYYATMRRIQIQEHKKTKKGQTTDIKTEYIFM
jgi:hypothetical protein